MSWSWLASCEGPVPAAAAVVELVTTSAPSCPATECGLVTSAKALFEDAQRERGETTDDGLSTYLVQRKKFYHADAWTTLLQRLDATPLLYVGNISFHTTEEQLFAAFSACGPLKRLIMGLNQITKTPCGFCFVEYYRHADALACQRWLSCSKVDERVIRADMDPGFEEGRQYGRSKRTGGQVGDDHRREFDSGRGGVPLTQSRFASLPIVSTPQGPMVYIAPSHIDGSRKRMRSTYSRSYHDDRDRYRDRERSATHASPASSAAAAWINGGQPVSARASDAAADDRERNPRFRRRGERDEDDEDEQDEQESDEREREREREHEREHEREREREEDELTKVEEANSTTARPIARVRVQTRSGVTLTTAAGAADSGAAPMVDEDGKVREEQHVAVPAREEGLQEVEEEEDEDDDDDGDHRKRRRR